MPGRAHGYFTNSKQTIKDYSLPTLPRIFSENGYRTAAIGKMHFRPARMHHGFGEMFLMEELPKCRQDDQYATYLDAEGLGHIQNIHGVRPHIYNLPQNAQMDEAHHGSTWVADRTIAWLKANKNRPFFTMAGWISPHPPWDLPPEYQSLYRDRDLPEPVPHSRCYPFDTGRNEWYGDLDTPEEKRRIREAYYAAITMADRNIGRVLDYLRDENLIDNTLVIFTSDHGEMLQDKGFYTKQLPYDGSVRIPFIVRYPARFTPGAVKEEFVDLFDIMPTCLDIGNMQYTGDRYKLPGESLCAEAPQRDRSFQVSSFGNGLERWVMSRNRRYKYIYNYNRGAEEIYDLAHDPGETVNLKDTGDYLVEDYRALKQKALDYERTWGPEGLTAMMLSPSWTGKSSTQTFMRSAHSGRTSNGNTSTSEATRRGAGHSSERSSTPLPTTETRAGLCTKSSAILSGGRAFWNNGGSSGQARRLRNCFSGNRP